MNERWKSTTPFYGRVQVRVNSEAFGLLFERHGPAIYNYCVRRVGSWAVAEDLVSIVFLEAWRRVDKQLPMFIGSWAALMLTKLCYGRFSFCGRS